MTTAVDELWEGTKVSVNYATTDGGYYCETLNREPFHADEIVQIEERMRQMVSANDPLERKDVSLSEAQDIFAERGDSDKVQLLDNRSKDDLTLYILRERPDYYFGYMVPSTGYLKTFRLIHQAEGFILQYPRRDSPNELKPMRSFNKLGIIFHQADEWMTRLGISNIGQLNHLVQNNTISELIMVTEALHEQRVAATALEIYRKWSESGVRVVLIAGPTSSGKTTFSKRLAIQLLALGLRPFTLEMDHYFVDRELTPLDDEGNCDFEALEAVNLSLFNQHLKRLLAGHKVQLPHFNFHTGKSEPGSTAQLDEKQIIIIEGIHGMNPDLVPEIPPDAIFRVYVSVMAQLNIDSHNRVPTTDVRLLRRIVRDARSRGYDATDTLNIWGL